MLEPFGADRANFPGPVMITGAGGCIGSWVLALLARAGVPACAFDLSDDKRRPRLLVPESDLAAVQLTRLYADANSSRVGVRKKEKIGRAHV